MVLNNIKYHILDFGKDGSSVVLSFFPLFKQVVFLTLVTLVTILICSFLFDCPKKIGRRWSKVIKYTLIIMSIAGIILTVALLIFQKNITRLNAVLMRNEDVIEQPIEMETLTSRIVNESIHFINKHHQNSEPFLLMTSFLKGI